MGHVLAGLVAMAMCVVAALVVLSFQHGPCDFLNIGSGAWRPELPADASPPAGRVDVAKKAVRCGTLGDSRPADVRQALGPPLRRKGRVWRYLIADQPDRYLVLTFDPVRSTQAKIG